MIKWFTYSVIIISLFLGGCRTIKETDFTAHNSLGTILPPLQGTIDLNNLKQYISTGNVKLSGYYNGVIKIKQDFDSLNIVIEDDSFNVKDYRQNPNLYYTRAAFTPTQKIHDIIKKFADELKSNVARTDSGFYGNIHLKLIAFKEKKNPFLTFFSIWTLCVPTLIGVPFSCVNTSLTIQLIITNKHNETIGKYEETGKGTAWIAMYWGYGKDAARKSSLLALTNAMDLVKTDIKNDKKRIISKLILK